MKNMIRLALLGSLLASASVFADVPQKSTDESQVVFSLYEIKDDGAEVLLNSFATLVDKKNSTFSSVGSGESYIQSCTTSVDIENNEVTEIKPSEVDLGIRTEYKVNVAQGSEKVQFDFSYRILESMDTFRTKDSACSIQLPRVKSRNISGTLSDSGYEEDFVFDGKKMKVKFEVEKI